MGVYLRNSFLYALVGTIVQLVFDVLAAYAFARMTFRGRDLLFGLVLSTMMLPAGGAAGASSSSWHSTWDWSIRSSA